MAQVRLLYKTDHRHSSASRDLIGVFTSKQEFEKAITKIITIDLQENYEPDENQVSVEELTTWMIGFFLEKKQTQGLESFELVFEVESTNKIF